MVSGDDGKSGRRRAGSVRGKEGAEDPRGPFLEAPGNYRAR